MTDLPDFTTQTGTAYKTNIDVMMRAIGSQVIDRDLTAPPGSPSEGDTYIVGAAATGDWATHDDDIAWFRSSAWVFATPSDGWRAWIIDEDVLVVWDSSNAWVAGGGSLVNLVEDTTPQLGGDLDCNGSQVQWSKGADVASAAALPVLTDGNYFDVTGTTTVTSIDTTGGAGTLIKLHFDGILTLTHHATNLILPHGADILTAAGDEAEFVEYGTGTYRCTNYTRASGSPLMTNTNDAADAGDLGEHISSTIQKGSAVSLTTTVPANVTSISLTAGDWDISGVIGIAGGATTNITILIGSISQVSATLAGVPDKELRISPRADMLAQTNAFSFPIPTFRISLASTTTVYLVAFVAFSVSTCDAYGAIRARRIR